MLEFMEGRLGNIETRHSDILQGLFCEDPTPVRVAKVSAFFYRNRIPPHTACFFNMHADNFTPQILLYYHSSCTKLKHLNGRVMDRDVRTPLGFAEGFSECTEDIQLKLRPASQIPPPL
jgi:hypothetical protein